MALHRRELLAGTVVGAAPAVTGCLSRFTRGTGGLTIVTSHPDPQTLVIDVAPEYDAESTFAETITVTETATPIERTDVVTGRNGDDFFVEVRQETIDETFETIWKLTCADTDEGTDRLVLSITEWGEVRFSQDRC